MDPLTYQYAIENDFTPMDCVRYFKPEASDQECDFILWEKTCFPASTETMIAQLNQYFEEQEAEPPTE